MRNPRYPNLEKYMKENKLSFRQFGALCKMDYSTLYKIMRKGMDPQKRNIDCILKATGMPYEVCFKEDEK